MCIYMYRHKIKLCMYIYIYILKSMHILHSPYNISNAQAGKPILVTRCPTPLGPS